MITYYAQVVFCMAVFYSFYHLALRRETLYQPNRLYLLSTLLLSFILPLVRIYIDHQQLRTSLVEAPIHIATYVQSVSNSIVIRADQTSFNWSAWLSGLYLVVAVFLLAKMIQSVLSILGIKKRGQWTFVSGRACIVSGEIQCPFSFFSTMYLPLDHAFTERELEEVMLHEEAHVKGNHTWDVLLVEVACILMWCNPLVYMYRKAIKELHEFLADAVVIRHTPWDRYAGMLVANKNTSFQMRLSNHLIFSQLKKRLLMMNKKPSPAYMKFKYAGMLPIVLLALVFFSFRQKETTGNSNPAPHAATLSVYDTSLPIHHSIPEALLSIQNPEPGWAALSGKADIPNPVFPGCDDQPADQREACGTKKLYDFISSNLVYPETVKRSGIEGKVLVKFTVGADGFVKNASIIQALHPDADQAVLNLVNTMNQKAGKWTPAIKNGKEADAEMILPVLFKHSDSSDKAYLPYAEEMPRWKGCEHVTDENEKIQCANSLLFDYIFKNLTYPKEDRDNNVEGVGIVQFVVNRDGSLSDIKVARSPSQTISAELIRLFTKMSSEANWIPGKQNGELVNVQYTLPVKFVLQQSKAEDPAPGLSDEVTLVTETNQQNIKISPNPAKSMIRVELFEDAHTVIIVDAAGKQVLTHRLSSPHSLSVELNISNLPKGSFVVQVLSNTLVKNGTFIKE